MIAEAEKRRGWRRAGFALILAALVAAPWPYGCAGDGSRFALTALLLAGGSLWCVGRARAGEGLPERSALAFGLPALAVLQLLVGTSAAPAWTAEALLVLVALLATFLVVREEARTHGGARWLAGAVLVACALQACFGAWQWSFSPARIYGSATPIVTSPFGSYVNHNHFAGLLEMGTLLAAGLGAGLLRHGERRASHAVLAVGLTLGLAAAHLASRSRGGLVALVAGFALLGVLAVSRGSGTKRTATAFAALGLLVLGFGLLAIPTATRRHLGSLVSTPRDSSRIYRLEAAAATLRTWGSAPLLGTGLGAFADAVPAHKRSHGNVRTTHAESDVLEIAAEGGLVGLGLLGALAISAGRSAGQRLARGRDPVRSGLTLGAAAGAGALVVHSLFDFNLRLPANALTFAALAGLATAPHGSMPPGRARPAAVAAGLLAALAMVASWRAIGAAQLARTHGVPLTRRIAGLDAVLRLHPYLSEGFHERALAWRRLGETSASEARLDRAARDLERALRLRPRWGEARAELGWTRFALGDTEAAARDFAAAVALDPTHRGIAIAHAAFLARSRGQDAALGELRRLETADPSWNPEEGRALLRRYSSSMSGASSGGGLP